MVNRRSNLSQSLENARDSITPYVMVHVSCETPRELGMRSDEKWQMLTRPQLREQPRRRALLPGVSQAGSFPPFYLKKTTRSFFVGKMAGTKIFKENFS